MNKITAAVAGLTLTTLVLAGCGDDADPADDVADGPTPTPSSDPTLLAPRPVRLGADPGTARDPGVTEAATADAVSSEDPAMRSSMIAPWSSLRFEFASGLTLPTSDTGYVFGATVAPDPDAVVALARALGVEGDLTEVPSEEGGGWRVGPGDGTAASLTVAATGQLDWWYSSAWAAEEPVPLDDCVLALPEEAPAESAPPVDDATVSSDSIAPPTEPAPADSEPMSADPGIPMCEPVEVMPPAGVPGAAEAERRATDIAAAAGLDLAGATPDVYADEWSANVTYLDDDPTRPPRYLSFGFGGEGALQWASGTLGTPDAAGPYPLVGLDEAIERMRDAYEFDSADFVEASTDAEGVDPALVDPAVLPEGVEPIEQVVVVDDVRAALWAAWDDDGSVWYVPAYEFVAADGSSWIVPAVTDEYLVVEEPRDEFVVDEPAAEEVVPGIPEPTTEAAEQLVGLTEAEATDAAAAAGWTVRVVERDGEPQAVTMDLRPDRVNVVVVDSVVTAVASIG